MHLPAGTGDDMLALFGSAAPPPAQQQAAADPFAGAFDAFNGVAPSGGPGGAPQQPVGLDDLLGGPAPPAGAGQAADSSWDAFGQPGGGAPVACMVVMRGAVACAVDLQKPLLATCHP